MKKTAQYLLGLGAICAAAISCGGGGGGGSAGTGGAAFFITDNLKAGYDHVWVTIKEVSLSKVGGGTTTVFADTQGVAVDLRSLNDANGNRFRFLSFDDNLSGQYESVSVKLDDDVILYTTGSATGLNRLFQGSVGGEKTIAKTFPATTLGSGNDDFIIDFDLAQWDENGTEVTNPVINVLFDDDDFDDDNQHERDDYSGVISGLQGTAPNQSFTINDDGNTFTVQCDASTEIFRSGGSGNPVLSDGMHVEVKGFFDPSANKLLADRVKIEDGDDDDEDEAEGEISNLNTVAGSFDLSIEEVENFIPEADPIHVVSTGLTTYRNHAGNSVTKEVFFAELSNGSEVEAEGTYDAGSNTLTARKMKLEGGDGDDDEDNGEVTGATSSVNSVAFTFKVAATQFSGINVPPGTLINVVVTGSTIYRPLSGGDPDITKEQFFAALTGNPGQLAEVEGNWNGSVLTAFKCKLEDEID